MQQRGRKSAASKTLKSVNVEDSVTAIPRSATPPADFTEFEASIWTQVVNTKPADWFGTDTHPLLIAYCKHVATAAVLDRKIAEFEPEWMDSDAGLARYDKLLSAREKQSRAIMALARSMRLTQQSQYDHKTANTANKKSGNGSKTPWEK